MKYYSEWEKKQTDRGVDIGAARETLKSFKIETPSWGYGNSGTRFKVFPWKGAAGSLWEKLDDAAAVNKFTGCCPTVAIHIPWDKVEDYDPVAAYAAERGIAIGAVNPNLFQDEEYKFGSLCAQNAAVRRRAMEHMLECAEIMKKTGSKAMSLWLADGTNYPGQGNMRARKHHLIDALEETMKALPQDARLLIEYKCFEPAFYHTDLADWGMAFAIAKRLGDNAQVLVDLGHHLPGANVEHIVAFLLDEGRLGGFHFNNRKYADDDLIVGSINPYELFLIFNELISGMLDPATAKCASNIAYMIDQSHNIEPKIPAMIRSVLNIQTACAKALLINREKLNEYQLSGDVMAAENEVRYAFEQDAEPLLVSVREEIGVAPDPMEAFLNSGYQESVMGRAAGKGWG